MNLPDSPWDSLVQLSSMPDWAVLLSKATLVLAVAWLLHVALARANPRWRVLLWRGVVVAQALLVAWSLGLPGLEVGLPAPQPVATTASPVLPTLAAEDAPARLPTNGSLPPEAPTSVEIMPVAHPVLADDGQDATFLVSPESSAASMSWQGALLGAWGLGVALLLVRLAIGYLRLARLVRSNSACPPEEIVAEARRIAAEIGCRWAVRVHVSRQFAVPFLFGPRRPVLVLPERMCRPDYRSQLPAILAHELTHVRSRDFGWNVALQTVSIVLWFHPLAWRIGSAHRGACDAVCDAVSASHVGDAGAYCRTLARVALEDATAPSAGLAMARSCDVRRRVAALQRTVFAMPLARRSVVVSAVAGLVAASLLAGVRLTRAESTPEADPKPDVTLSPESSATAAEMPKGTAQPVVDPAPTVHRRAVNKRIKDFPEKTDLSTPESALAAYHRASARMDAKAVLALSWRDFGPRGIEKMERFWKRDPKDIAIYNQAQLDAEIIEVLTYRDDYASVISKLEFPKGVGRDPYSRRSFGRINGVWKQLGEDRLPSVEAARANSERKKERAWELFLATKEEVKAAAEAPKGAAEPDPDPAPAVHRRAVNKRIKDFPEKTDLSTPESALAAYCRAGARRDAKGVLELSWRRFGPREIQEQERFFEHDPKNIAIYYQAVLDAEVIEVLTYRDDYASVISKLEFPEGVGRVPYSRRSFGRIKGVWKNLGEDRLPSLEAARASFERKKERLWKSFLVQKEEVTGGRPASSPPTRSGKKRWHNFEMAPDPEVYRYGALVNLTLAGLGRGRECFLDLDTGKLYNGPDAEEVEQQPAGRELAGMKAWAAGKGIDLLGEGGGLAGFELVLLPVNEHMWNNDPPDGHTVSLIKQADPATPALLLPAKEPPTTVLFRTREGAMGMLQVVGYVEHKTGGPGVKIRYKQLERKNP